VQSAQTHAHDLAKAQEKHAVELQQSKEKAAAAPAKSS